ncbi:hypothetical protein SUGI_0789050 [Cryptomeria japonica]|nr:hypothetical protein SUGI_0789050 [Cryptomeria japonica]
MPIVPHHMQRGDRIQRFQRSSSTGIRWLMSTRTGCVYACGVQANAIYVGARKEAKLHISVCACSTTSSPWVWCLRRANRHLHLGEPTRAKERKGREMTSN